MIPSSTARRYAEAAFDVAREQGDVDAWIDELRQATRALSSRDTKLFFQDPNVATEEKLSTLERGLGQARPEVLNLLRLLAVRQRLTLLPGILREMEILEREAKGIVEADVTVARPISPEEERSIADRLQRLTGKRVDIKTRIDPAILGGLVVRLGDRVIDASVAGRLQRLRQQIAV